MSTDDRKTRVEDLFARASSLPRAERTAFLIEACPNDAELRAEVESLLEHESKEFLENPAHLRERDRDGAEPDEPDRIGDYRIVEVLGRGGMGVVYLAEQERPVRRKVALKLIKLGMDTREVVARFDGERQALALMNHPCIAHVYDAGATERGRPYFVMEHVPGVPITEHCDKARLDVADRLGLFVEVCDGIQHAHQKGVIHRDLKPSNVLVAYQDDRAVPKIIDFGVAKATQQRLAEATVFTELGHVVGTPEYMSPEQAELTSQDIDTRTDVYSLGVMLYELLAGVLPFDPNELRRAGFDELRRRIREDDPPRPSARFSSLGDATPEIALRRRSDPHAYARELRGDLDWIVMKALDKDRGRRYASASELAADIGRHLADEPVLARPPGALYRVGKFVRRHRLGVVAGLVVVLTLVGGLVGTGVGLVRALRAEQVARTEATTAGRALAFLVDLFENADPTEGGSEHLLARDLLDSGAENLQDELTDEPEVRGRLLLTIGKAYRVLGAQDAARELLQESVEVYRSLRGPQAPEVAVGLNELGATWMADENFDRAITYFRQAVEIAESYPEPDLDNAARFSKNLGAALFNKGDLEAAAEAQQRALEIQESLPEGDPLELARVLGALGRTRLNSGDPDAGFELLVRSLEIRETDPGARLYDVGFGHYNLANAFADADRHAEAASHFQKALLIWEQDDVLGPEHGHVGECVFRLAGALWHSGEHDRADPLYRRALAIEEKSYGAEHPYVAERLDGYVSFLRDVGRTAEAERLEGRAARIRSTGPP